MLLAVLLAGGSSRAMLASAIGLLFILAFKRWENVQYGLMPLSKPVKLGIDRVCMRDAEVVKDSWYTCACKFSISPCSTQTWLIKSLYSCHWHR